MTKSVSEEKQYNYKNGIVLPPENFPSGCTPILVDTFVDAMVEARKRTKDGILILDDTTPNRFDIFNQVKEPWKAYHNKRNDFKEEENPYKYLQEGKVLITNEVVSLGFEWTTLIIFEGRLAPPTYHECNFMMRCTTNLIIVKKNKPSP
uniref:Uncharacterized protein n=1 Tax=Clytia hemisphaerica TaxID=252671 RepID=A0A7M5WVI5_9CNID